MCFQRKIGDAGRVFEPLRLTGTAILTVCLAAGAFFLPFASGAEYAFDQLDGSHADDARAWQHKFADKHGVAARFRDCASCPEMAVIPPAKRPSLPGLPLFAGQPPELEQIDQAFAVSVAPITFEQFGWFEDAMGIKSPAAPGFVRGGLGFCESMLYSADRHFPFALVGLTRSRPYLESSISPVHPVVCVDLLEVQAYLDWLTDQTGYRYRLPTEAEWEFAARAGASTRFWWGDDPDLSCRRSHVVASVWSDEWRQSDTACPTVGLGAGEVALRKPNAFGLHDVIGNVWEWTASCADSAPHITVSATTYDLYVDRSLCESFVTRGGSLDTSRGSLELSAKKIWPPLRPGNLLGFRVARDL